MQRPRRRPSRSCHQLDLGLASLPAPLAVAPAWCALPQPTQWTVTELLTRLLIAHAGGVVPELESGLGGEIDER